MSESERAADRHLRSQGSDRPRPTAESSTASSPS